ncbi:MAG: ATPase, T2SS/T4P/T4SS family [Planctomycetota bacterium]|nr:ATPase, T2SS/T4P/T4SS family [Planctomycetota bacterium]
MATDTEGLLPNEMGPPVDLRSTTSDNAANQTAEIQCRQSMGIVPAKQVLYEALVNDADRVLIDCTIQGATSQIEVDGLWQQLPMIDPQSATMMVAVLKTLAHLNAHDRVSEQNGEFTANFGEIGRRCHITSMGTQTGERVVLKLETKKPRFNALTDLGIRDEVLEEFKRLTGKYMEDDTQQVHSGIFIISAPANGGGLSTAWTHALGATDRFMRDFICFEPRGLDETEVENIQIMEVDLAAGETFPKQIEKAKLKEPDVYVLPYVPDKETLEMLCDETLNSNRMSIISINANDGVEAIHKIRSLGVAPDKFAKCLNGVMHMRLCRKLCDNCKQPFQPGPQYIQQIGLPPSHVQVLYQHFQPVPDENGLLPEPCYACSGKGFAGRTGIFELIGMDDQLRQAVATQPDLDVIRQLAQQLGHRSTQQEGVLHLARGITSIQELQRALSS